MGRLEDGVGHVEQREMVPRAHLLKRRQPLGDGAVFACGACLPYQPSANGERQLARR